MLILVTGATGKVGRSLIARLLDDPRFSKARIRALCHNRLCDETDRVEVTRGLDRRSRRCGRTRSPASPMSSILPPAKKRLTTSWT